MTSLYHTLRSRDSSSTIESVSGVEEVLNQERQLLILLYLELMLNAQRSF